jgi:hypothetical protein
MGVEVGQSLEFRRERGREEGSEKRRGYQLKTEVVVKNTGLIRIEQRPQEKRRAQAWNLRGPRTSQLQKQLCNT